MKKACNIIFVLALAGCATKGEIVRDRPRERVAVAVSQPCAGSRPGEIVPLNKQLTHEQWLSMDVKQKAAFVARQALDRKTYGEKLHAATAACP